MSAPNNNVIAPTMTTSSWAVGAASKMKLERVIK